MKKKYILPIVLWLVAVSLLIVATRLSFFARGYTEVSFVDVGQGDCCLIRTSRGSDILIDGGEYEKGDKLISLFNQRLIKDIEAAFISHIHSDHFGGIYTLLESDFRIEKLYLSGITAETEDYEKIISLAGKKETEVVLVKSGSVIEIDEVDFTVVAVGKDEMSADENNNSMLLRLDCGENSVLFTGDTTASVEAYLLDNPKIDVDFLKVGHHGSAGSTSEAFLRAVSPELSVIGVGAENRYGHPSEAVLEKHLDKNIPVMRTDMDGTVTIIMTADDILNISGSREREDVK